MRCYLLLAVAVATSLMIGKKNPGKENELAASLVTLKSSGISLQDALNEVRKQTGNQVVDQRGSYVQPVPNPTLRLDLNKVSFWEALDRIAKEANVQVSPHGGKQAVAITPRRTGDLRVAYAGPFRIAVKQINSRLDLENEGRDLLVTLELACEPRWHPILLHPKPKTVMADFEGQPQPAKAASKGPIKLLGLSATDLDIRLPLPPRAVARIKRLEGEFEAIVSPELLTFKFANVMNGEKQTVKEVMATLRGFKIEPTVWTVDIALNYPRGILDLESHQTWIVQDNEIFFQRNGKRLNLEVFSETSVEEGGPILVTYRFTGVPEKATDLTLVYRALAAPVRQPVRFQFDDLPLP